MRKNLKQLQDHTEHIPSINLFDYRAAFTIGLIVGMLIVGLPQLIGVAILLSMLMLTIKLVNLGRI